MSNYTDDLRYTIAKRIPDMNRGFKICTNYGDFFIEENETEPITKLVRKAFEKHLKIAMAAESNRRPS